MCDISTQCTTIDESQRVKQFQMITDYIITSEYIPQHLTNCQKQLAVNLFEFTTQPQSFASNCTLMSELACLNLSLQIHRLILSLLGSSRHFSPASFPLSFWPLRCRSVGLYMVQSICHGLEVANLTCSLGLALLSGDKVASHLPWPRFFSQTEQSLLQRVGSPRANVPPSLH